jgi:hypothetical protein
MASNAKMQKDIFKVVREGIKSGDIIDVKLNPGLDADGDPIFNIYVVFDNKKEQLDPAETTKVSRSVWEYLYNSKEPRFPIFYFVAKSEAGELPAA